MHIAQRELSAGRSAKPRWLEWLELILSSPPQWCHSEGCSWLPLHTLRPLLLQLFLAPWN